MAAFFSFFFFFFFFFSMYLLTINRNEVVNFVINFDRSVYIRIFPLSSGCVN